MESEYQNGSTAAMTYHQISEKDFDTWLSMALKLWKTAEVNALRDELRELFNSPNQQTFIARNELKEPIGFANLSIRHDGVVGSRNAPTGYLEGIYVAEQFRKKGVAKQLLKLAESWLKENHCLQIGSDTWLTNTASQSFHKKLGFVEKKRLVHFLKDIE